MWWSLVACVPDEVGRLVQSGEPVACLDAPETPVSPVRVTGFATADGEPDGTEQWDVGARCDQVTRRFELVDGDGELWRVGYGWQEAGSDATVPVDVGPDSEELDLEFRFEADTAGFVLQELGRVVAALSVGIGDPALPETAVPGLSILRGESRGSEATDCGRRVTRSIVFEGDEVVELEPVDAAWTSVAAQQTRVWALAAWGVENATCAEDGELSWAVWREDPA